MSGIAFTFVKNFGTKILLLLFFISIKNFPQNYSTCKSFDEIVNLKNGKYPEAKRITSQGTLGQPTYNGFFFYNCSPYDGIQFDPTGRYMLCMQVSIEGRIVEPTDTAYIGIIDTKDNYKWTKVGKSTAWNWQQGCRLQWIPRSSEEFFWNDRTDDGKLVCRIYNIRTHKVRTLPFPIYTISPDGITGLTHEFERMKHEGTNYEGIKDKDALSWAPEGTGIYKVNIVTGETKLIISLARMADIMFGKDYSKNIKGTLYFFREGWNPSGTRFIAFVKDVRKNGTKTYGYTMNANGKDVRFFYSEPSHHYWIDDETVLDNGVHINPENNEKVRGFFVFKDDGTGKAKGMYWKAPNGHDSFHKNGDWVLADTYNLQGYQYPYMFYIPTKTFVPLGKFKFMFMGKFYPENAGIFRVDLHPRFSPDGKTISFDSTHDGLGRQMYIMDVSYIINNPPLKN